MANNIMNIMSVSFNSQAELEDFLNRVKGKDDDGEKDFSLQSVVPMPESLQIVSPCDRMLAWAAVNKYGIDPEKYPENVRKAICRETFLLHRKEKLTASDMVGVCKEAAEGRTLEGLLQRFEKYRDLFNLGENLRCIAVCCQTAISFCCVLF